MEVTGSNGEVIKNFSIQNFSRYTEADSKICCEICVDLEFFKSVWELTIFPMYPDGSQIQSAVNCDVVCQLECTFSSAPSSAVKSIEVLSMIKGRENYPKELRIYSSSSEPTWKGTLISRVTLESCKLICKDEFCFSLRFVIPEDTINRAEDGTKSVIKSMDYILRNPEYHDVCLVSSSGSKFFVHASVLHARSNILKTGKVLSSTSSIVDNTRDTHDETSDGRLAFLKESATPSKVNLDRDSCTSDATDSESSFNKNIPLFQVSCKGSSPNNSKLCSSLLSPSKTVVDNHTLTPTPKRGCRGFESPRKPAQTYLTNYFPRSSSLKIEPDSDESSISLVSKSILPFMSPIRQSKLQSSPAKSKRKMSTLDSPQNKNNFKENGSPSIKHYFKSSPINSPCGTLPSNNFQNSKRKLFEDEMEEIKNIMLVKLNMSTSVTQEVLSWIYTGESKRLRELCRPLLVAAIRHNIEGLVKASQLHLVSLLSITNTPEMLLLSQKYNASILQEEAMNYALLHAKDVTQLSSWSELSLRNPEVVLEFSRRLASKIG